MSDLYDSLGAVGRQVGQFDVARTSYEQSLEIRRKLANANPADEGALHDLVTSYVELARLREAIEQFDGAVRVCETGIAEFERLGNTPSLQAQMHRHLVKLQRQLEQCLDSRGIAGDLAELLKGPPERLPNLLRRRCRLLAAHKDIDGVAQAAAALRDLKPKRASNLYHAACGYGLCAKLAAGWPGAGPFEPAKIAGDQNATRRPAHSTDEQKYRQTAFDLLEQAEHGGFLQMHWAPQEQDLAALHALPEFKTLVNRSPKPKRPYLGG